MKLSFAIGITALAGLLLFSGCEDSKRDEVALRVAAFTYAFEHDSDIAEDQTAWTFSIESELHQDEVVRALSRFPIAKGSVKIEDRDTMRRVDLNSGKRFAHWTVKITRKDTDEAWAHVGCVKVGLNGYGQILVLKCRLVAGLLYLRFRRGFHKCVSR
jgi:major membrane immunogen (membrane-anchored lipoprotein)